MFPQKNISCYVESNTPITYIYLILIQKQIKYIKGDCNQTLKDPKNLPDNIAFLRLDTDWYESTLTEILQLWHNMSERLMYFSSSFTFIL